MSGLKFLPDQYSAVEGDLPFLKGATRTISPETPTVGAGDAIRLRGAHAAPGSGLDGGNALLRGGNGDGAGKAGGARVEGAPLYMDKLTPGNFVARGATQIKIYPADDIGDTEWFADTPQGIVQITKDGLLNTAAVPVPTIDASFSVDPGELTTTANPAPAPGVLGPFATLDFVPGADHEIRAQRAVPAEFRDSAADTVDITVKYAVTAGANTIVKFRTSGACENVALAPIDYNLDVSAAVIGTVYESPIIRSVLSTEANPRDALSVVIRRVAFGGEFAGNLQLVSVVFRYRSQGIVNQISLTTEEFFATALPTPPNGVLGAFRTVDFAPAVVSEIVSFFTVPRQYQTGSDCFLRIAYAMGSAAFGARVDLSTEGSVNNTGALPPQIVSAYPGPSAGVFEFTLPLRNLNGLVGNGDSVAVLIKRLAGDTHPGTFRLVSAQLVMGATLVTGTGTTYEQVVTAVDEIPGVGPPNTDSTTVQALENEAYGTVVGTGSNQDLTYVFRSRRPGDSTTGIMQIEVAYKNSSALGNNKIVVSVRRGTGAVIYTSANLNSATRALLQIPSGALASQPAAGEQFLVLVQATVDSGDTAYVGAVVTLLFS